MSTAVYDRQIRLWGLQTQSKISESKIFLYGYHSGLLEELAKDLVLTGVGTLVIGKYSDKSDENPTLITYLGQHLDTLVNALSLLNPQAQIQTVDTYIKQNFPDILNEDNQVQRASKLISTKAFGIFCLVSERTGKPVAFSLDRICRENNVLFVYTETVGALGYLVLDLGSNYTYYHLNKSKNRNSKPKRQSSTNNNEPIVLDDSDTDDTQVDDIHSWTVASEHTLEYPSLEQVFSNTSDLLQVPNQLYVIFLAFLRKWKEQYGMTSQNCTMERKRQLELFLELHKISITKCDMQSLYHFCSFMDVELLPVSSCLAGVVGREMVKLISRNEKPIFNTFIFDAFSCLGSIVSTSSRAERKRSREEETESVVYEI